jgi:DNA-directed RNA polymerase specialized sigma24 family protein
MLDRSREDLGKTLSRQAFVGRAIQALADLARHARSGRVTARLLQPFRAKRRRIPAGDEHPGVFDEDLGSRLTWLSSEIHVERMARRVAREMCRELGENRHRESKRWAARGGRLTPHDLEAFLARISPDGEQAGALYEDLRHWLSWFFERLGMDSEGMVTQAFDRTARSLAQRTAIDRGKRFGFLRFRIMVERAAVEMYLETLLGDQLFDSSARLACLVNRSHLLHDELDLPPICPRGLRPPAARVALEGRAPEHLEAAFASLSRDREQAGALYEDIRRWLIATFEEWRLGADSKRLADEVIERGARWLAVTMIPIEKSFGYFWAEARSMALEMRQDVDASRPPERGGRAAGGGLTPEDFQALLALHARLPPWTREPSFPPPNVLEAPGAELAGEHFEALLRRLSSDREQAGALYEDIRRRLIALFEGWQLSVDSESLADQAIDRVALRLAQGTVIHIERPFGYFWGVAYRVALEMRRVVRRRDQALDAFAALYHPEPELKVDPHLPCFRKCLDRLSANERCLILRYFEEEDRVSKRQRLAEELGIGLNALRIRTHRARRKLEGCYFHCLEVEAAAHRDDGGSFAGSFSRR